MIENASPHLQTSSGSFDLLLRRARLASGLVLMVFLTMHLGNHALNLISLKAAEEARPLFLAVWRNPLGTALLYGSVLVHVALTLAALYRRRTLAMPARELAQILLGLTIPLLIVEHVVGTRVLDELFEIDHTYEAVVRALWISHPLAGARQTIALLVIWTHGCLGLFFWLRYRRWYPRAAPWLLIAAVLVPTLALLGFAHAGQEVSAMERPSSFMDPNIAAATANTQGRIDRAIYLGFTALVATVLTARVVRDRLERRSLIEIRYADGHRVRVPKGYSVLEASRLGGIPHYAVCGGRGRCSTCRVRVIEGLSGQTAPGPIETATLRRIGAGEDVRLACQLRPVRGLVVSPLLAPSRRSERPLSRPSADPGHEQVLAVMFCDMRGFTALSDRRLPYDVVFLLNRYFAIIGEAVETAGGRVDKFIGDGALAIFGLENSPDMACRQALAAARAILADVHQLSEELSGELQGQLKVAIGIHVGPAIVGSMGYGAAIGLTAVGDTVNIGSRLESAAKDLDAEIVISEAAARRSRLDFSGFELRELEIRGRAKPLRVRVLPPGAVVPA
ncbi:adenylate/guanylate cyclase domain-containing protein [Mesorhizobium sp. AaZ16]|uniref:adenylate/guanylate cyclase domain-containing protein n=1 Tax=Mesorhizobium sp. AaZ16 TaxID=3402289 RepID=UPI00374EFE73